MCMMITARCVGRCTPTNTTTTSIASIDMFMERSHDAASNPPLPQHVADPYPAAMSPTPGDMKSIPSFYTWRVNYTMPTARLLRTASAAWPTPRRCARPVALLLTTATCQSHVAMVAVPVELLVLARITTPGRRTAATRRRDTRPNADRGGQGRPMVKRCGPGKNSGLHCLINPTLVRDPRKV